MISTDINWQQIDKGTEVKVSDVAGAFIFMYERNGEITVYGGSRNPNGHRMFRTFTAERVRPIHRRSNMTKFQAGPSVGPRARSGRR